MHFKTEMLQGRLQGLTSNDELFGKVSFLWGVCEYKTPLKCTNCRARKIPLTPTSTWENPQILDEVSLMSVELFEKYLISCVRNLYV